MPTPSGVRCPRSSTSACAGGGGLHLFGREAAQALPEALLPGKIQGCVLNFPTQVTAQLRADPEIVEVLAANFAQEQLHAAKWALVSPNAASIARDRAEAFDSGRARTWAKKLRVPRRLDLNEASAEDLMLIPGIGPVYSRRILAFRARRLFESIEELRQVPGVGAQVYTQASLWLHVGPPSITQRLSG